ncbi:hypothetical protein [Pseudomonas tohonis]|uniref:hypothetical protein n=1 Tax=Pseudomonas tohonis TaxID=2725477 RepID=UPI00255BC3A0|nr:hypothetical protein [Pseudomonas tohonis]
MKKLAKLILAGAGLLGAQGFTLNALAAELLGKWDLNGDGTLESVYRGTGVLEVRNAAGALERSYNFGNVTWTLATAANTDSQPGAELVVKAGPDVAIVNHALNDVRKYTIGNTLFDVVGTAQLDGGQGDEVIVRTGNALVLISNLNRTRRNVTDGITGTWQYQGAYNLGTLPYATLAYTAGTSLRLYDYSLQAGREFPTDGVTSVITAADLDGAPGNELVARSSSSLLVITGGVQTAVLSSYPGGTGSNWSVHGTLADTDGQPGQEVILALPGKVRVVHQRTGQAKDYTVSGTYAIYAVADRDGVAGAEITVVDSANRSFVINDRLGTIKPL